MAKMTKEQQANNESDSNFRMLIADSDVDS